MPCLRIIVVGVIMNGMFASVTPVLMYHEIRTPNVADSVLRKDLSCSPQSFSAHLKWLAGQGYTTITTGQLIKDQACTKSIMLSFDDGRESSYFAAKELKQRGLVGVFYINTAAIGTAHHLSSSQIIEMSRMGMEIGSHTVSHPDLRSISTKQRSIELKHSKDVLSRLIAAPVTSLAYPSGAFNQSVISAAVLSGYLTARTTEQGVYRGNNAFRIPVIRIHSTTQRVEI